MTRNYVIVLRQAQDKASLLRELGSLVKDPEISSLRCVTATLTESQANSLSGDVRIESVEVDVRDNPNIRAEPFNIQRSNFARGRYLQYGETNWGLARCSARENPYSQGDYIAAAGYGWINFSLNTEYRWNIDSSNVDIIIVDTGVEQDHPEFAINSNGRGGSRVVDYDWHALAARHGFGTFVPAGSSIGGYLGDSGGHGTHVAGTAAGNTQGWARNARIYSLRIFAGYDTRTGLRLGAISHNYYAQLVYWFHREKLDAGIDRPTLVNNSWGLNNNLNTSYNAISRVICRGRTYNPLQGANGPILTLFPQLGINTSALPARGNFLDSNTVDAIGGGAIIVGAAGNAKFKMARDSRDPDWNNYVRTTQNDSFYYHRGSSPAASPGSICVGNLDWQIRGSVNEIREVKSASSNSGPRIDIWAPGEFILSAYPNGLADQRNRSYFLNKISGTSMASPQVCGVLALVASANPSWNQQDCLNWLIENATTNAITEELLTYVIPDRVAGLPVFANELGLFDAPNRLLYLPYPFTQSNPAAISGLGSISGQGMIG